MGHVVADTTTVGARIHAFFSRFARHSPARLAVLLFLGVCLGVALLLSFPISTTAGVRPPLITALFTAVSVVSVTGLTVVDTGAYWSIFGQVVIMLGIVVGGLGIMTAASIMGLVVSRRLGLTQRILMASETKVGRLGDIRALIRVVIITALACQLAIAALLLPRFIVLYGQPVSAAWHALFYGVSAFNNAGFVPTPQGLTLYGSDWFICLPLILGAFIGSLGFPVILNIFSVQKRKLHLWRDWSLHTKLTIIGSLALLVIGFVTFLALEFRNPETLLGMSFDQQLIASLFAAIMPRSAGFNILSPAAYTPATRLTTDVLMFIGGGSAGTAGGIKVTTLVVLLLAIRAEARGDRDIEVFHRRIPGEAVRVAVGVVMVGAMIVVTGTLAILTVSGAPLDIAIFEVLSAFATVGLPSGLTEQLNLDGQIIIIILMFIGRIGSMTLAAALALRDRKRVIRYPEERPIIG
ncbi:MAG: TrkH family potassium uptake protein [Promicromonosporaceae bacterium]|nr:TrkH family potassium uptake protein [Promicromonosporaceae bacterium]